MIGTRKTEGMAWSFMRNSIFNGKHTSGTVQQTTKRFESFEYRIDTILLTLSIVAGFVFLITYPIPPLTDFLAFIGISMTTSLDPSTLLRTTDAISYKLLHILVYITTNISTSFAFSSLIAYIFVLISALLPAMLYLRCTSRLTSGTAFATLLFWSVLQHSLFFIWGTVAFLLAFWWFLICFFSLLLIEEKIRAKATLGTLGIWTGSVAISLVLLLLSHPFGSAWCIVLGCYFLFSSLALSRSRLTLILSTIAVILGVTVLIKDFVFFDAKFYFSSFKIWYIFPNTMESRYYNLLFGTFYNTERLLQKNYFSPFSTALTLIPFMTFLIFFRRSKALYSSYKHDATGFQSQAAVALSILGLCLFMVFGPDHIQRIIWFPFRVLAAVTPLMSAYLASEFVGANVSTPWYVARRTALCGAALICFFLLRPMYATVQDYFVRAAQRGDELARELSGRCSPREGTILVRYDNASLHTGLIYRFTPFIMPLAPRLLGSNIFIVNEWNDTEAHLPARYIPGELNEMICKEYLLRFTGKPIVADDLTEVRK